MLAMEIDHYLVTSKFALALLVNWRIKNQLNSAVKLNKEKIKNSSEVSKMRMRKYLLE